MEMLMLSPKGPTSSNPCLGRGKTCPNDDEYIPGLLPGEVDFYWKGTHHCRRRNGEVSTKNSHSLHPSRNQTHPHRHPQQHQVIPNSYPSPLQKCNPQTSTQCCSPWTEEYLQPTLKIVLLAWNEARPLQICMILPNLSEKNEEN